MTPITGARVHDATAPAPQRTDGCPLIADQPSALYRFASAVRGFEELTLDLFRRNLVAGTTHTCIGQEICQIAVARALLDVDDLMVSTHRNHGHYLARTGDFSGLLAEIMGRATGVCGGRGGSQHISRPGFHSSGVQAGLTALAVGHAWSCSRRRSSGIAVAVVGDGTLGEGLLYESLNLASVWGVPVLFVVENNGIAQTTSTAATTGGSIAARGVAFGLRTWELDDAEPTFVGDVADVVAEIRRTRQPGFLIIKTIRLGPHSKSDDTRTAAELAELRARDPLARLAARLDADERTRIDADNRLWLAQVERDALAAPPSAYERVPDHLFACGENSGHATAPPPRGLETCRASLTAALTRLLRDDPRVVLLGEDLHDPYGGAFKVTQGLSTAFPGRVISTPISEAAIVGAGIGLALAGDRPIVEIMFGDFLTLAMDQLVNHAVKLGPLQPGMPVPLVVRAASGGRRGYGPTHSQSFESLAAAVPGLTVVAPSFRHDPGVLLERAVRAWPHPTIFFESKIGYGMICDAGDYREAPAHPLDPAARLFPLLVAGPASAEVTLVTTASSLPVVEEAARQLAGEELTTRVAVLPLLAPLPVRTIRDLLLDAPFVAVVDDGPVAFGVGAEVGALLAEAGRVSRFLRIGARPVPVPAARTLESAILPGADAIVHAVFAALTGRSGLN
jgi:2-oxoisovalerate dehydrogenase E1 component